MPFADRRGCLSSPPLEGGTSGPLINFVDFVE